MDVAIMSFSETRKHVVVFFGEVGAGGEDIPQADTWL